jgi:hypothetical protein
MKTLRKFLFLSFCIPSIIFVQTSCTSSNYKIVKSEPPPAPGKGSITGTVISETDGKPLENVEVLLCRDAVMLAGCSPQIGQTTTDRNGVYWFRNLPPGSYITGIRKSENAIYVLQEQKRGESFPKPVLFNLEAGKTIQIEPQKVTVEALPSDENAVKLTFPTNSETIRERKPKLAWEANPNADAYGPYLVKLDTPNGEKIDIDLETAKLSFTKNTSVAPLKELDDGLYEWGVYPSLKDNKTPFQPKISKGYFVVIGGQAAEK